MVALTIMGAIWTGGLLWSLLGGLVLVPQSPVMSVGSARTAAGAAPAAATKPAAATTTGMAAGSNGGATDTDFEGYNEAIWPLQVVPYALGLLAIFLARENGHDAAHPGHLHYPSQLEDRHLGSAGRRSRDR